MIVCNMIVSNWKSREIVGAKINYELNGTLDTNHNRKQEDYNPLWSPWLRRRKKEWMISPPVLYTVSLHSPSLFYTPHKKLEKPPSKIAKKYSNFCFDFLPWDAQMALTEEFTFQIVAYRPTIYKTGISPWDFTSSNTRIFSDNFFVFVWKKGPETDCFINRWKKVIGDGLQQVLLQTFL